jgi:hypothetical protein
MVRRRGNPFAEKQKRLPYKALLRRDDPFRPSDADEVEAMKLSIASGTEYLSYAGALLHRVLFRQRGEGSRDADVD